MNVEAEIKQLVDQGYRSKDISKILGMHEGVVLRHMANMPRPSIRLDLDQPFGLSDDSIKLRMNLGSLLTDMINTDLSRQQIARITGVNQREQIRASSRPYAHDWSLSQIERTLKHFGLTLKEVV